MADEVTSSQNDRIIALSRKNDQLSRALKEERRQTAEIRSALGVGTIGEATSRVREWSGIVKEHGELKAQSLKPDQKDARIKELEGTLRTRDHRDAFAKAAAAAGVKPEAVGDLYALSGLQVPESGEIQADGFGDFFAQAKASRAWAFSEAGGTAGAPQGQSQGQSQGITLPATPPPAGAGRGASDLPSGRFTYKESDLSNPAWMQANQGKLADAFKAGTAQMVPG